MFWQGSYFIASMNKIEIIAEPAIFSILSVSSVELRM